MEFNLQIQNQAGLHARPAAMFAQKASSFKSNIMIFKEGKSANAKSIISIMGLGVKKGDNLLVKIDGPDAAAAGEALKKLVMDKFGEE
ncbi:MULTISPECIES: HPr family phosphocarrier protein [unclassified Pelosinus]|uniref:HPr family phosphocarrier protein n=1 Tax=unclassified Pelosinus TaxID=2629460 RepID=UPI0004D189DC|nr:MULTISPECIES: HPr family phosphocarrier protein [unclassified Pelosinus]AIF50635.1 Phosphotransferase system, phosphocarrier protein HPr [Pelosinus sp. UFO1]GMA97595.1 phosphocarrier protein HPr [Pelosinus sp. IPA-1]